MTSNWERNAGGWSGECSAENVKLSSQTYLRYAKKKNSCEMLPTHNQKKGSGACKIRAKQGNSAVISAWGQLKWRDHRTQRITYRVEKKSESRWWRNTLIEKIGSREDEREKTAFPWNECQGLSFVQVPFIWLHFCRNKIIKLVNTTVNFYSDSPSITVSAAILTATSECFSDLPKENLS